MKKVAPPSAATEKAWKTLAAGLEARGAETGAMFGMPTIKLGGKAFLGLFGDALVFKLTGDAHAKALASKGAALFDPSGMGRPMKEWVVVPAAGARLWAGLAGDAFEYSAGAATKKKAPARK